MELMQLGSLLLKVSVILANQSHPLNLGLMIQILKFLVLVNVQSLPNLKRNRNAPSANRFIFWRIVVLTVVRLTNEKGGGKSRGIVIHYVFYLNRI